MQIFSISGHDVARSTLWDREMSVSRLLKSNSQKLNNKMPVFNSNFAKLQYTLISFWQHEIWFILHTFCKFQHRLTSDVYGAFFCWSVKQSPGILRIAGRSFWRSNTSREYVPLILTPGSIKYQMRRTQRNSNQHH